MIDEAFLLVVFVFVVIRLGNFTKGREFFSFFFSLAYIFLPSFFGVQSTPLFILSSSSQE
jgi:hypothetical protein